MSEHANFSAASTSGRIESANDDFKRSFGSWFWSSMIAATVLHFAIFNFWPAFMTEDMSLNSEEMEMIDIPPEIEIPPPPEQIARPAMPVVSQTEIDEDITISPTTFEDNPIENFAPPPEVTASTGNAGQPPFTPFTVEPTLRNRDEVGRALERNYPAMLKDAGRGGTVNVWFHIDSEGKVIQTRLVQSSGFDSLDQAALAVADIMQFSPAMNRDQKVEVWVQIPITFEAN